MKYEMRGSVAADGAERGRRRFRAGANAERTDLPDEADGSDRETQERHTAADAGASEVLAPGDNIRLGSRDRRVSVVIFRHRDNYL